MTKFALFDVEGLPVGFYTPEINTIPENSVEITDEQWQDFMLNQGARRWENGQVVEHILPPAPPVPLRPALFATLGVTITDGALTSVEMAAQLQGAYYEPGYLQVGFVDGRIPPNYLVFVQCDVPATMTQYKSEDGFELVFADTNGDAVNPGRLDIQILEVR